MAEIGTQESKRLRRAIPPTTAKGGARRRLTIAAGLLVLGLLCLRNGATCLTVALALPPLFFAAIVFSSVIYGFVLLVAVRARWTPRGVRCLLVHSNSPLWEAHIRRQWLPRFGHLAVLLNLSERSSSHRNLAVRVFKRFCGERQNYNPAVVVFKGLRAPLVFRFFYAFQETKAGRDVYLRRLEAALFEELGVEDADGNGNRVTGGNGRT